LRKHLSGKRIESLHLTEFERSFSLRFVSGRGDPVPVDLIVELYGRHGNMILTEEEGTIINALQIVPSRTSSVRAIVSGEAYSQLPPPGKTFLPNVTEDVCREILREPWDNLVEGINRSIHGISREILSQVDFRGVSSPTELLEKFHLIKEKYREGSYGVAIRERSRGFPGRELLPILDTNMAPGDINLIDSPSEAADEFFIRSFMEEQVLTGKNRLGRAVRKILKKVERRRGKVREDIAKLEVMNRYGKLGELLKQSLHSVRKGQRECTSLDYSVSPPQRIVIDLDPSLSPVANMKRYFRLYRKGRKGIQIKKKMLPSVEGEIEYLQSSLFYLEESKRIEELDALERELKESGLLKEKKKPPKKGSKKKRDTPRPPSMNVEKIIMEDFTVYAGKNNLGNDHIIKNLSSPGDIWLHAKKYPGSHILIKRGGTEDIPETIIYACGREAARRSRGASEKKLEIYVVDAKEVKKIPGQKPGLVRVGRHKTIMVDL
jgi:predicted ribosome quality control (RQC) complex YloA/Tae2 family protein